MNGESRVYCDGCGERQVRAPTKLCRDCTRMANHEGIQGPWREKAACYGVGSDWIFPNGTRRSSQDVREQRDLFIATYCRAGRDHPECPMRAECRREAESLADDDRPSLMFGVWDGVDWSMGNNESVDSWYARTKTVRRM